MIYVDVYESIHHKIINLLDLNVYHIFLNNMLFIFLYCTKPRILKEIHRTSFAFCDVRKGKHKYNSTQRYAPCHN